MSHKAKYAVATVMAFPEDGYTHPDDGAKDDKGKPKGTENVSVTVQDAVPPTESVEVELYTE